MSWWSETRSSAHLNTVRHFVCICLKGAHHGAVSSVHNKFLRCSVTSDVVDVLRFCVATVVEQLHGLILSLLSVLSVSIVHISDFALLQIQSRHSILFWQRTRCILPFSSHTFLRDLPKRTAATPVETLALTTATVSQSETIPVESGGHFIRNLLDFCPISVQKPDFHWNKTL